MKGLLKGLTVVSFEQAVAAPFCTSKLADLGARVIKIERPRVGDFARAYDRNALGASSYFELDMAEKSEAVLDHEVIRAIAQRLGKTPAQVVLRWGLQRDTALVVKSVNPDRMAENLALDDFALSDDDMAAISALNMNRRFNDPGDFCEAAFNTFHPIYD